jgi:2-oxoglutarate ferredoxin oxidoreductase subunit delta
MSKTYEIVIQGEYCKGCGLCARFCPLGKLSLSEQPDRRGVKVARVDACVDCTGCQQCVIICPDAAIEMFANGASSEDGEEGPDTQDQE